MKAYKHVLLTGVCMLWFCFRVMPQLCPSNALAPVFKQDFGQGTSALSTTAAISGTTNYIFGGVGTDGNYVLTPSFDVSGKADWTKLGDHTGNTFGNMFLVNAGGNKSIFFKQTVTGLCSGSTFNFSAWLANANTASTQTVCGAGLVYPKVIFNIRDLSNTILATFTTPNLPLSPVNGPANWQQYGFQFSLPNGTTALVLEMVDYYGGAAACGNDLALDDILFTACTPQVSVSLNTASAICSGTSTTISSSLVNSPFVNPAYQWQKSTDNGTTWANIGTPGTAAANYQITNAAVSDGASYRILVGPNVASLTSSSCVSASAPITLTVYPSPSVTISASSHVCTGFPLSLFLTASGGTTPYTYIWSGPNAFTSSATNPTLPSVALSASGVYALSLTDANNCLAANQVSLSVLQTPSLSITNNSTTVCTGSATAITATSSVSGSQYSWSANLLSGTASGYAAGVTGTLNTINDLITNNSATSATISYNISTITPDGCGTAGSTTVTIQPTPTAAHAGTSQTLCAATAVNLVAGAVSVGVGAWSFPAGTAGVSFANAAAASTTVTGLTTGIYHFVWSTSNGVCAVSTDTVTVTINAQTVPGTLSTSATVCSGVNSGTLTLNGYTGDIQHWESSSDNGVSWVIIPGTSNTYTYSNVSANTIFRVLVQSGVCAPQYSNIVTIGIDPPTIPGTLSGNTTVCAGANSGTISLAGYTGNILYWETSADNGSTWSTTLNTGNTFAYTNLIGTTRFRATVQSGVCNAAQPAIATVTVDAATVPGVLSGTNTVCAGGNGAIVLSGYTGNIKQWELSTDNGTTWHTDLLTSAVYNYTNLSTTSSFRALVQNGVCAAQYTNGVTATVNPVTVAGSLTSNATVCLGTNSGTISLTGYTGAILQWETSVDNGSTWSNTLNTTNSLTYTNLTATTFYRVKVQSGVCGALYSNITTIAVDATTVAGTVSGITTVCAGANTITISLSGNTGSIQQWENSIDNGNTWTVDINTSATNTYTNLSSTTQFRALLKNGVCPSLYANPVTVTVNSATIAGTLSGTTTVCAAANNGTIDLLGYTGDILQWQTSVNNGSTWSAVANINNSLNYTNLTATTLFRVQVQSGVCNAAYSNMIGINVNATTVAGTLSGTTSVCANSNTGNLNLSGFTGDILRWENSADNGASWNNINNTSAAYTYSSLAASTAYRALVQSGLCPAQYSNPLTVSVDAASIAGVIAGATTVCATGNHGSLSLTGTTGNVVTWESSVDNGTIWLPVSNTSTTLSYNNLNVTTVFRASVQNGICAAAYTVAASVTVDAATNAGLLAGNATVCSGINTGTVSLSGNNGNIVHWETSVDNGTNWTTAAGTSAGFTYHNVTNTTQVRTLLQNGTCAAAYANPVTIQVDTVTVPGTITGDTTVCAGANTGSFTLSGNTGAIVQWETSTDNGNNWVIVNSHATSFNYTNTTATTQIKALVQNGVCSAQYASAGLLSVNQPVTIALAGADQTLCQQLSATLVANSAVSGSGNWQLIGGAPAFITNPAASTTAVGGLVPGNYTFAWTISNQACPSSSDTVSVTVLPGINNAIDTARQVLCFAQPVIIDDLHATGGNGIYQYQWQQSVDSLQWNNISGATTANFATTADSSLFFRRTILSSACFAISDPVAIIVHGVISSNSITGDQRVCIGTAALSVTGSLPAGGNGIYQYQWQQSIDGGQVWTDTVITKDIFPGAVPATTLYRRTVRSGACNGSYSNTSNVVTVAAQPVAKAALITGINKSCAPFSIDSTVVKPVIYSNRNSSYDWYVNDTLRGSGNSFPAFALLSDSAMITLKTTGLFGCGTDSISTLVSVYASPKPSFTVSDTLGCGPLNLRIANTTPDINNYQFAWNLGTGTPVVNQSAQQTIVLPAAANHSDTIYIISVKAYQYCDTVTISQPVVVGSKAKADLFAVMQNTCSPLNVVFSNRIITNGVQYRINYGDGTDSAITAGSNLAHTYHTGSPTTFTARLQATNGCGTDSASVSFATTANPVNTDLTIKDTTVCGGPYTMTLYNNTNSATSYQWDLGDGSPLKTTTAPGVINYTYSQPGVYLITNTISSACSDSVVYRKMTIRAGVKALAANTVQNACIGKQVAFQNLSDSLLSSRWNFGDGTIASSYNASHAYAQAGTYATSLIVWKTYSDITCADSLQQPVSLLATAPGHFILSDTTGKCLPFITSFINKTDSSVQTRWSWGDGSTGNGDSTSHTFTTNGSYQITMQSVQKGGCTYIDSAIVNVHAPSATLAYQGGAYCKQGNRIEFTSRASQADSIRWDFGDGESVITTSSKVNHSYNISGGFLPKVSLIGSGHCVVPVVASDSIFIDEINAGFKVAAVNNCAFTNYVFTDTSRSFFAITSRQWTLNEKPQTATGLSVNSSAQVQQVYTKAGDYEAGLQVSNRIGCTARLDAKFNVMIYEYPKADISAVGDACLHNLLEVKSIITSQDSIIRRAWNLGNGTAASDSIVKVQYYSDGNYIVKLNVGTVNNCYDSAFKQLSVHPLPVLTVANKIACLGDSVELKASGASGYIWKDQYDNIICNNCAVAKASPKRDAQYQVVGYNEYGCSNVTTATVRIIQPFQISLQPVDSMCEGGTKKLFANGADTYRWLPVPGLSNYNSAITYASPATSTTYQVIGQDANHCFTDTASVKLIVGRPTPVNIGTDTSITAGVPIQLNTGLQSTDIRSWQWGGKADYSCVFCASPIAKVIDDEYLTVKATNQFGCISTDTLLIKTFCSGSNVFIPNAFTPDGDGVNDILVPLGTGIKIMKSFRIFSRWGELVFERTNFMPGDRSAGWDGKIRGKAPATDVYVYLCEAVCEKGTPYTFKGNVAIIK